MKLILQCCLLLSTMFFYSNTAYAQPVLTIDTIIHAKCNTSSDGAIFISVAGVPPFSYAWNNGRTTQDVTGLFSGSYRVTVTAANGVTVSSILSVNAPPLLNVNTDSVINNRCAGTMAGKVFITVLGGVPGYTYIWDNGSTTQDVTGLGAGPVNLTVTDANGCSSSSKSIFLDTVQAINLVIDTIRQITCNGGNNGFINITGSGGSGALSYLWSSGQTTADISGLSVGMYTVTLTDTNNCVLISGPHSIGQPAVLAIVLDSIRPVNCNGNGNGAVFISVTGGTSPFIYNWSNARTTQDITGLNGGSYSVTTTDANGCTDVSGPHVVNEPTIMLVVVDAIIHQLCANSGTGAVNISVSGATSPYTYIWTNGTTTQDATGLFSGANEVTVTDANGCTAAAKSIFLDSIAPIVVVVDSIRHVTCNGANNGAVFITVSGGRGGTYLYNWSNGATTQDITGLAGGSYTVTTTDSSGCVRISGPHLINEPTVLAVAFDSLRHVLCNGTNIGAVFVTPTGGTTAYSYNWTGGRTTQDITGLAGGSYSLTLTDANGCTATTGPHVVNQPTPFTITFDSLHHITCNGAGNGAVFITVAGGTIAYDYNWSNGLATQDITGLNGGTYSVTITDANGCTLTSGPHIVNEPAVLVATFDSLRHVSCNGFNNGAVFVTPTGGTTAYLYNWSNGRTTQDITGLGGGSYTLTLTDANGCSTTTGPHVVNEPAGMTVTLNSINHVSCNGALDGSVLLTITGGLPTYGYNWSNAATTEDITGLAGGSYTLTVSDANGCTISSGPHVVNEATPIVITLDSIKNVDCNGNNTGAVSISVTGGVTTYAYNWSNSATTQDISGLAAGSYTVTVTDNAACTMSSTAFVVTEPAVLVATFDSLRHVSCNGFNNGAVFVTPTGGTTAYLYNWSNGRTTQDITGLGGGSYTLTLTDANGCSTTTGPHVVNEPAGMTVTLNSINHVSCNGALDGSVLLTITGGLPTYGYNWSNAATTEDITGLAGGSYTLTVSDANGCTISSGPHVVNEATPIVITLDSIKNVDCNGNNTGAVSISVTGGVMTYTYNWSNSATTQDISGLAAGSYTVTVTDNAACTMTTTAFVVTEPAVLVATLDSIQNVSCNAGANGAVFISIGGGTVPFSYNWSNGFTTQDITGLVAGTYTVTVTDSNSCVVLSSGHIITEPTALAIALDSIDQVTCNGATDGAVFITATGGTTAYAYNWPTGVTTQNITGLNGGSYTLTLTDANGCTLTSGPHVVIERPALVITFDSVQHVSCNGAMDGGVFVTTTGGLLGYNFAWSNGGTSEDITGLNGGAYTITATDADGCTATTGVNTVNEPAVLAATLDSIDNVSCNGGADGAVFISIAGGTVPFSYNWSNGFTSQDITGLLAGTYTVTVTDSNSCVVLSAGHIITEPLALLITFDSVQNVSCSGAADGAVFVTTTGGAMPYSFNWSNGVTTEDNTGLAGGSYSLTVTDNNGCTFSQGHNPVLEPTPLVAIIDTFKNESCFGIVDGFISTSAQGGTMPYSYNWSSGQTLDDITGLIAGTYTVTMTDSNNCVAINTVIINDIPTITVTVNSIDSVSCNGLSDGAISVTTSLGAANYTWLWSNAATTEDISGLAANGYTVTVTDALGCTATFGAFDVFEPAVLTVTFDNSSNVSCAAAADGAVNITVAGGTLNYTYIWSGGQTTEDIANLSGSSNSVTVTDLHGCTATSGAHIVQEASMISITLNSIDSVTCNGAANGAVFISVAGGTPIYSYNWNNNGGTNEDATGLSGNAYTVTVTDAANCTMISGPHVVNEPAAITLAIVPNVPLEGCLGEAFGELEAIAAGGFGVLNYNWSNSVVSAINAGLNTGTYDLTVTDANGCTISSSGAILDPVRPIVNAFVGQSPIVDTTINWNDVITINAGNDQTAQGVSYAWTETTSLGNVNFDNSSAVSTSVNPKPDSAGTYSLLVTATSTDGCVDTGSVWITVKINDLIGMPNAFSPNGDRENDYFRPAELDDQFILEFKIFNRWGQVVFDDTNTDYNWDGKFQGVDQPSDVYLYILRYKLPNQPERAFKGEMTLLR